MNHVIYTYGTLRPGKIADVLKIKGALYDLGSFPAIRLHDLHQTDVIVEPIIVSDEELSAIDNYEGYFPDDIKNSLYIRCKFLDGWIYVFNRSLDGYPRIECGDWLAYKANP